MGERAVKGKNFVRAVSQKPQGVGSSYLVGTWLGGVGVQHHGLTLILPLSLLQ